MRLRVKLLHGACALAAVAAGATGVANAQQTPAPAPAAQGGTVLSDIVVTARKREESLQSVPVAVTSNTAQQLQQQRVTQPTDLGRIVPSLRIQSSSGSGNSAQIALRGQYAGDSLLGVSQPVGLYQDQVNIPHPFGANNGFFDLQRVEVLKGPQGTLYGRNTTGGAINIITRSPDYSGVHGFAEAEAGDYNDLRAGGAVNVPIIADKLAIRLGFQHWSRDGFGKSIVTGQKFGDDHDDDLVRLGVRFDPIPEFTSTLKVEYSRADHNGAMLANRSLVDPNMFTDIKQKASATSTLGNTLLSAALWQNFPLTLQQLTTGQAAAATARGAAVLAPCIGGSIYENCSATPQFDNLTSWHGVYDWTWNITDTVSLRGITGVHSFRNFKVFDLDSVQPQILEVGYASNGNPLAPNIGFFKMPFGLKADQQSTQWTQEFDLSGKFMERLDWLVGAFMSWDKGHGAQQAGALEELTAFGSLPNASPLMFSHDGIRNKNDTWALFTQNDVHISDRVSLTLGLRYTEERLKQDLANWHFTAANQQFKCDGTAPNGLTPITFDPPIPGNPDSCALGINGAGPNGIFSKAKSSGTSYLASFNFQATPDMLLYLKTSRGFRGGAFGRSQQIPASPEIATDYEGGLKADWFDRRLRTNIAIYQTNYDNKQVSTLVCIGGEAPPCGASGFTTVLLNAATARIRGAEVEFQAVPMEGLSVYGNMSYTDAKYVHWPNATSGDGVSIGAADGLDIGVTPDWQATLGARYEWAVWKGTAGVQLDWNYRGNLPITPITNQSLVPDALEEEMQAEVNLINGRIDYKLPDEGVTVSLWATNLTDEKYGYEGISAGFTGGISHLVVQAPRMWGVTVRKTFGEE